MTNLIDYLDHRIINRLVGGVFNETTVNFQEIDLQVLEVGELAESTTKIIKRKKAAHVL